MPPYEPDHLSGGTYKHHEGSSASSPVGGGSWIQALCKAHEIDDFGCCQSSCDDGADTGAHIRVSSWHEIGGSIGLGGGTAVVPMCKRHHGTGPVEIEETPCIWDSRTPIDLNRAFDITKPARNEAGRCATCGKESCFDIEGDAWCANCCHYVDESGKCCTEGCSSCEPDDDDYDDDDDDDDYDDDDDDDYDDDYDDDDDDYDDDDPSCDYCGEEFETRSGRNQHCDDKGHWQCNVCERLFDSKYQLNQHRESTNH